MQLVCKNVVHRLQKDSKGTGYTGTDVQLGWHCTSTSTSVQLNTNNFTEVSINLKVASISLAELSTGGVGSLEREQTITLTWYKM